MHHNHSHCNSVCTTTIMWYTVITTSDILDKSNGTVSKMIGICSKKSKSKRLIKVLNYLHTVKQTYTCKGHLPDDDIFTKPIVDFLTPLHNASCIVRSVQRTVAKNTTSPRQTYSIFLPTFDKDQNCKQQSKCRAPHVSTMLTCIRQ